MSESFVVQIGEKDDDIGVDTFLEIMNASFRLLNHLSENKIAWAVGKISHNSPVNFEMTSSDPGASKAILRMQGGFSAIRRRRDPSKYFDSEAMRYASSLRTHLDNDVSSVSYKWRKRHFSVPMETISTRRPEEKKPFETFTELEGTIERLDIHGGKSEFVIYDRVTGIGTICRFKDDAPEELGKYMAKRLRVFGKASFSKDDEAKSISVLRWEPVGESVSLDQLQKAGIRLKRGLDANEIIRSLRELDD